MTTSLRSQNQAGCAEAGAHWSFARPRAASCGFEGKLPFFPQTLKEIKQFKAIYGPTLQASDSHHLQERQ
jgi:hypothetical protein